MPADPTPVTPGPIVATGPATMLGLGAALGADVWWLDQVFDVAGTWVASTDEAAVRAHLAELSRVAGDHALALRSHLPRPASVDPEGWVVPPSPAAVPAVTGLRDRCGDPAARLAALHRVLVPRLMVGWDAPTGATADGARRAIRHARTDLTELRDDGEALLHALMDTDVRAVEAALVAVRHLELEVVGFGGLRPSGPPSLPA